MKTELSAKKKEFNQRRLSLLQDVDDTRTNGSRNGRIRYIFFRRDSKGNGVQGNKGASIHLDNVSVQLVPSYKVTKNECTCT